VGQLLQDPLVDTQVTIHGRVRQLGELRCPCFELASGGEDILVWYSWYEGDWPTVSVQGIQNGDRIVVTGELKRMDPDPMYEFAATKIEN
jgi:hypothetical protein